MTTYHIIEKNERLAMKVNPSDTKVYKEDNTGLFVLSCLTRANKTQATKIAKDCGMDVAVWIGSETSNFERVFIS